MLQPHPHEGPPEEVHLRQQVEGLHRLLNSAEAAKAGLERERDLARWQVILDGNKIRALEEEKARLLAEVEALAGEVEELRARLEFRQES